MTLKANETWHPESTQQRVADPLLENKQSSDRKEGWGGESRQGADMGVDELKSHVVTFSARLD